MAGLQGRRLVQHRRRVGFVFQAFNLIPGLTAEENVGVPPNPAVQLGLLREGRVS